MRLDSPLNEDRGLTEIRQNAVLVSEGEQGHYPTEDLIEDITSSEVTVVDDMIKVNEILGQIRKLNNVPQDAKYQQFYDFFGDWASGKLDREGKNKFYSEHMSHELNLFIKKRDPAYFQSTVLPFIACKMEKKFVDHYLLGNHTVVAKYAERYEQLNAME